MSFQDKFREEKFYVIDYSDLDSILAEAFPQVGWQRGDFIAYKEVGNDSGVSLTVTNRAPDPHDAMELEELQQGKGEVWYGTADLLMDELCRQGKIEPGRYLVEISW